MELDGRLVARLFSNYSWFHEIRDRRNLVRAAGSANRKGAKHMYSEGPMTVVLVHGAWHSPWHWNGLIPHLGDADGGRGPAQLRVRAR